MEYGIWNIHNGLWATNTIVYSDTSAAYTNTLPQYSCNNTAIATIPNILKTMVPSTLNEDGNETQQSDSGTNDSTQHSNSSHTQTQVQNKQLKTDHDATKFMKKLIINNVKIEDSFAYINQQLNPVYHLLLNHLTQQQELSNCESYENSESIKEIEENESNNKQERELFECSICHVNMKSSDELKSHLEVKHFNNEVIVSTFTSVQSEIGDGNYNENSNSSIKRQDRLSLQRVRYEREEYHCTFCSYTCTIEKAFYRHLRAHSNCLNDKEYITPRISCVICGKDRASENDMVRHMQKHKDNRHFCCDICVFRTVQLKKLIQHRRMHTGEKPHLCPHCIYRSARRDNLRSHVRRVHKKDNLFCDTFSPRGLLLSSKARNINDDKC